MNSIARQQKKSSIWKAPCGERSMGIRQLDKVKGCNGENRQTSSVPGAMSRKSPPSAPTPTIKGKVSNSCGENNIAGRATSPPASAPVT